MQLNFYNLEQAGAPSICIIYFSNCTFKSQVNNHAVLAPASSSGQVCGWSGSGEGDGDD
jgi:hypothetical protein